MWRTLITLLRPYAKKVLLAILANGMMAFFMVINIPLFIPLMEGLFQTRKGAVPPPSEPLQFSNALQHLLYQLDRFLQHYPPSVAIWWIVLLIVLSFFLKNFFRYLSLYIMAPVRSGILYDLRRKLYDKLLLLPLYQYADRKKGDFIARITSDVHEVEWSIVNVIEILFREPLVLLGSLLFMFLLSWQLSLFVLVLILLISLIMNRISAKLKRQSHDIQEALGQISAITDETITGIQVVRAFGAENYLKRIFDRWNTLYRQRLKSVLRKKDLSSPLSEFSGIVVVALLIAYGSQLVFNGQMSPGAFFAFLFAFYNVISPSKSFATAYYSLQKGIAAYRRIEEIHRLPEERDDTDTVPFRGFRREITFKGVRFQYPDTDADALHQIDLTIQKGQRIAIVGSSGSGKTTLINLLLKFYQPTQGAIYIDDTDLRHIRRRDLRKLIGLVSQEPILLNDTVYANIAFGRPTDMHEVMAAAKAAHAHDFISQLERGYETVVGDRGTKLSGGQRQRITIARAILKNPELLILDEATSSLDAESEQIVRQALHNIMRQRTSIIIAHRLASIRDADTIVVLDKGKIVEIGTHDQLLQQKDGFYRKLVQLQELS